MRAYRKCACSVCGRWILPGQGLAHVTSADGGQDQAHDYCAGKSPPLRAARYGGMCTTCGRTVAPNTGYLLGTGLCCPACARKMTSSPDSGKP